MDVAGQIDVDTDFQEDSRRRDPEIPLSDALGRYDDFFALFESFDLYVEFFLLGDLIDDRGAIRFYGPFDDFSGRVLPNSLEEYRVFREGQLAFVAARNARIRASAPTPPTSPGADRQG